MPNLTEAQKLYVERVCEGVPFLAFNYTTGRFDVSDSVVDPTWKQIPVLGRATRQLCHHRPPPPPFYAVRLDELTMGYYDRCLEYYCHERLDMNKRHEETCWARYAAKTYCLGRIDPGVEFGTEQKARFMERLAREESDNYVAMSIYRAYRRNRSLLKTLKKDDQGWVLLHADINVAPLKARDRLIASAKSFAKRALGYPQDDRVLKVVRSIEAHGWDNDLAWTEPEGGAVLGYSRTTGLYFALTGRHRIAASRYLYSQGRLAGSTLMEFPVITYAWGPWKQARPHPDSPVCEWCRL
jgi:hypothetical protein